MQRENPARLAPNIIAAAASPLGGRSTVIQCAVHGGSCLWVRRSVAAPPGGDAAAGGLRLDMA
jgi:hypothetical protein